MLNHRWPAKPAAALPRSPAPAPGDQHASTAATLDGSLAAPGQSGADPGARFPLGRIRVYAAAAVVLALGALVAAHYDRSLPTTEWPAAALWVSSLSFTWLACRAPRAERGQHHPLTPRDGAALAALLVLGAALLLPWLEFYPLEVAGDPPRDSGVLTARVAHNDAKLFQYGYFNGFSYVMSATNLPFYLVFGASSLAFKGLAATLGLVTPLLLYLLARRYLPWWCALAASTFMSTLPAYIYFARREPIHAYNPFWMVVVLAVVMRVFEQDAKPRTFGLLGLVAGVTVHFHAAAKAASFAALGLCGLYAIVRTLSGRQRWRRLLGGGVASVAAFLIGLGPLILVSTPSLVLSSGRLTSGRALEWHRLFDAYLRSLRVFFDQPTTSWFPTHQPLIMSVALSALFAAGAVLGWLAVPKRLHLSLLFFVLVLTLTNSALTDIINGEHRLSPLFPVIGLLIAMGLDVVRRAAARTRPRLLGAALFAAVLAFAVVGAGRQVFAFFADEQAIYPDRAVAHLVYFALQEIEQTPELDRAGALCMGGSAWLRDELSLGHYRDSMAFYRFGQVIHPVQIEGVTARNEIYISASCLNDDDGVSWSTRVVCSPRQRFLCPRASSQLAEMRVRVDRRPRPPGLTDPGYTPPRSLPDTEPLRPGSGAIGKLVRVDVTALLSSGGLTIKVNDPTFEPHVAKQFDGDTRWPSRSDSINPLVFELEFTAPIRLAAARFFPFGPKSAWSIEARAGERWSLTAVDPGQWSQLDLPEPVETKLVRIELLRIEGDDNVHVSELELYAAPP